MKKYGSHTTYWLFFKLVSQRGITYYKKIGKRLFSFSFFNIDKPLPLGNIPFFRGTNYFTYIIIINILYPLWAIIE
jgi:hypothetical protein